VTLPDRLVTLPDRLEGADGLLVRRWEPGDAPALNRAVALSLAHLRPWMPWAAELPSVQGHVEMIEGWEREWRAGGDAVLGVLVDGEVAGGTGMHRRIGPSGLEIGYWTSAPFLRRGVATAAARLLTGAALSVQGIAHVEIHHDKANEVSARIPRRLGYVLIDETPDRAQAPAEVGISCHWRMDREHWLRIATAR
jgi:RimJ/RimL family protein N-acetyltransferase